MKSAKTTNKSLMSARIDPATKLAMEKWAASRKLPLSWVVERVIEIGWPTFQKRGIDQQRAS